MTDAQRQQRFESPLRLFYSYSHHDEELLDQFRPHLSVLRREGVLQEWHDRKISAGHEWQDEIDEQLESAHIVLLLISADFLASDYIHERELRRALEKHDAGQACVIPVILRPVDNWQAGQLGRLQALPTDGKAVTTWGNRDEAWSDVARGIRNVVAKLTAPPPERPRPPEEPEQDQSAADVSDHPPPGRLRGPLEDGHLAGTALSALAGCMTTPAVREAAADFRDDFKTASDQIRVLNAYKGVHDRFQQLEDGFKLVYHSARRLPGDEAAWDELDENEPEVKTRIDDLLSFTVRAPFAQSESLWTQQLKRAQGELGGAVKVRDTAQLTAAIRKLNDVLARQPSRFNTRLVTTADNLRLSGLVKAMTILRDESARLDSAGVARRDMQDMQQVEGGVDALTRLDQRLRTLVDNHNLLQAIDDEVRRVEGMLDQDVGEASAAWQDLAPMMESLCDGNDADWATRLGETAAELEAALTAGYPVVIKRSFRLYRSQASRSFHQVDQDLLTLCVELQQVGGPLTLVLQKMQDD